MEVKHLLSTPEIDKYIFGSKKSILKINVVFKCHKNIRILNLGILDVFKVTMLFQSLRSQNRKELSIAILAS